MLFNAEDAVLLVAVADGDGREHVLVGREVDVWTLRLDRHSHEIQLKQHRAVVTTSSSVSKLRQQTLEANTTALA